MLPALKSRVYGLLRWSERYTKTDMVYLATSSWWINLNFLFVSICSFTLSVAFANLVPKEVYGTYQYILSISGLLAAFTLSGYNTSIIRSVAQGFSGTLRASIRPQLLWNLLPASIALLWGVHYLLAGQSSLGFGMLAVGLALPITNTYNSYSAYLNGKKDFKHASLYMTAANAVYYLCIFIGILALPQALPLIAINLFVNAAMIVFLYVRTLRKFKPAGEIDPEALPYARHLSLMNALSTIAAQIDNVLVFHFLGATDLALYSIASLIPERLGSAFKSISAAALPRFTERGFTESRGNLGWRLTLLFMTLLASAGLYAAIAPPLFHLLYPTYTVAIGYSQLYGLVLVSYIGSLIVSLFSAHRKIHQLYILNTVIPILQIVLQVGGVILGGLWGLVIAKIASAALSSLAALLLL